MMEPVRVRNNHFANTNNGWINFSYQCLLAILNCSKGILWHSANILKQLPNTKAAISKEMELHIFFSNYLRSSYSALKGVLSLSAPLLILRYLTQAYGLNQLATEINITSTLVLFLPAALHMAAINNFFYLSLIGQCEKATKDRTAVTLRKSRSEAGSDFKSIVGYQLYYLSSIIVTELACFSFNLLPTVGFYLSLFFRSLIEGAMVLYYRLAKDEVPIEQRFNVLDANKALCVAYGLFVIGVSQLATVLHEYCLQQSLPAAISSFLYAGSFLLVVCHVFASSVKINDPSQSERFAMVALFTQCWKKSSILAQHLLSLLQNPAKKNALMDHLNRLFKSGYCRFFLMLLSTHCL